MSQKREELKTKLQDQKSTFLRQANQFRILGNVLCKNAKDMDQGVQGAVCLGLAEVCEGLANIVEKKIKEMEKEIKKHG